MVGLFALLPAVVGRRQASGDRDGRHRRLARRRGGAAARRLRRTDRHRLPAQPRGEAPAAWADALGARAPNRHAVTRAFSGRAGRRLATAYARARRRPRRARARALSGAARTDRAMREAAVKPGDIARMQAWAGQSARFGLGVAAGDESRSAFARRRAPGEDLLSHRQRLYRPGGGGAPPVFVSEIASASYCKSIGQPRARFASRGGKRRAVLQPHVSADATQRRGDHENDRESAALALEIW